MKIAPTPLNESERIAALLSYDILDSEFERSYDELTELASIMCGTPISLISLIDSERQWFKSKVGLEARETPKELAFCAHAILQDEVFVVENALEDGRFADNPLVTSDPHIRFYAGAPLITSEGHKLGTLCVIDRVPRQFDPHQRKSLSILAKQVMKLIELRQVCQRLQTYGQEMLAANNAKDRFFYIIAHDLRSPFNIMTGYAKMLEDSLNSPELADSKDMAEEISQCCKSTLKLLNNLLEWAMCESGKIKYRPSLIDFEHLADEVKGLVSGMVSKKSITLRMEGIQGLEVFGDRYMLFSVLQNLLHNALKFTLPGGSVVLKVTKTATHAHISVSDTGVGIPEGVLQSFLNLQESISTAGTAGEKGTGLGLLLCKQFVEKNGGRLKIASRVGEGSTFSFDLPLAVQNASSVA
ncbi:ATP-binding protein [Luteolibacter algae]|uniref:histidine kinase n=1 Tax=Luteolibacter algae TaxID=454151 RepID=A0ABW5D423_9BACT